MSPELIAPMDKIEKGDVVAVHVGQRVYRAVCCGDSKLDGRVKIHSEHGNIYHWHKDKILYVLHKSGSPEAEAFKEKLK